MSDINLSISSGTNVVTKVIESQNTVSINPTASVTPTSLLDLTDVNASTITNGQILSYNASTGKFTPSSDSNSNTTYSVSCVDGDNGDEEKIRLTDSSGGTDDVVLEAGTGLSIARSSDKITFTNTVTDTNLTTEAVQDIVGAMFTSNTETRIAATYEDGDGTIDLVVDDMTADTQLTTEAVQDIVGGMFTGNTETGIAATYEDGDGTIDLVVSGGSSIMTLAGAASVDTQTGERFISMSYSTADFSSQNAPMKTPIPLACTLGTVCVSIGGDSTTAVIKVYEGTSAIFTSAATTWTTAGDTQVFTVNSGSFAAGETISVSVDQSTSVDMNYVNVVLTLNVS